MRRSFNKVYGKEQDMKDLVFLDLLTFFFKAVPALLLALALWSLAIGFASMVLLTLWASAR